MSILETTLETRNAGRENSVGQVAIYTKVNTKTMKETAMEK
jgi:hypothetical protein